MSSRRSKVTGIRTRLLLFQVVVLAVAALVVDGAIFNLVVTPLRNDLDGSLYDAARAVEAVVSASAGKVTFPSQRLPSTNDAGVSFEVAVVEQDHVIATAHPVTAPGSDQFLQVARRATQVEGGVYVDQGGGRSRRRAYAEPATAGAGDGQAGYVVVVSRSTEELQATIDRLLLTLGAGSVAVVAVAGVLASIVVGRLLARLEASFEGLRRFTADASHELRAPLALMRNQVEVARTRERSPAEYSALLAQLDDELRHLTAISDQLLLLARADARALAPVVEVVDVADLVSEVGQRWATRAAAADVGIEVDAPDSGELRAQPDLLRQVLDNLVDNALRYAPAGSAVRLSARERGGSWVIDVADTGPGVPAELRPRLFERFTRSDAARDPASGHAGLGLAVSAAIAEAHGGSLVLADSHPGGSTFRLVLPSGDV
ncbi:MAG: hypothetical protein NVSMB17_15830 [Candidatus Dormibacteria bacterium]